MPGDVTQIILDDVKGRMDKIESRLSYLDEAFKTMYRVEAKLDQMVKHTADDDAAHKDLQTRVLKCETQLLGLRAELLQSIGNIEKKFLKWVAVSAAISGGAGASVLKALSLFGGS